MKKTLNVVYLRDRLFRLIQEYKDRIRQEESLNSVSRNEVSIKEHQAQIDGYRLVCLGLEKADDLVKDLSD